jgi:arabinogalactan oligomer / maltooligosaccharide transport system substrate-binding protein
MKSHWNVLALALALSAFLVTVAPSAAAPSRGAKAQGVTVQIWDYFINSPKERATLMRVANQWARKTGNKVSNPGDVAESLQKYPLAARSGRGPDIIQFPHDNLGRFAAAKVLASQPSDFSINRALYARAGLEAATYKGKLWGLPIALETTFLFYNKALVPRAPTNWNELITTATRLTSGDRYGFLWNPTDMYYNYAFIGGHGGFVFQKTKSGFNARRLGTATPGAVAGLRFIQDLVQRYKLVPATTNYDIMDGKFGSGQAAMVINGPWGAQNYRSKGINFGVAPLPTLPNGKSPTPFVGVQMFGVNSRSRRAKEAWDLVRYLSINLPTPLHAASGRAPATLAAAKTKKVKADPVTQAVIKAAAKGQPMPNIPEMGAVWTPANSVFQLLVKGELTPREAAVQMTNQIAKAIADQD